MSQRLDLYESDPDAAGDDAFEPGALRHLVPGNRGRMLDPRRTPVTVVRLDEPRGMFDVVVEAFEDTGAHWQLPFEDVSHFQFERDSDVRSEDDVRGLELLVAQFDTQLDVPAREEAREQTLREVAEERARIRNEVEVTRLRRSELDVFVRRRRGSEDAADLLQLLLQSRGLASLDHSLAQTYVSNPSSGEAVKGHAIVIAEMGLCPYRGKAVRGSTLFIGEGRKECRRAHVVLRLAFLQELMSVLGISSVELYRGMAIDGALEHPRPASLVAATFSREVATSHFESKADLSVLVRQTVPVSRLFMTFLETPAMNATYREAEAVLIGEPDNLAF